MEEYENINYGFAKNENPDETESAVIDGEQLYDKYYHMRYYREGVYCEKCFSCQHWHWYSCGAPSGPCSYKSF